MAKIKEFYNPSGHNGFINAIGEIANFGANWWTELGLTGRAALDDFILLKIGEREVFRFFENVTVSSYIKMSHIFMAYNYQLDGLWNLLIENDGSENGYNPLDNVNEIRHEETETDFDKGAQTDKLNMDDRKSVVKNPQRIDTQENKNKTTAFDSTEYAEPTESNESKTTYGASNIETTADATEDTTESGARHDDTKVVYDVKRRGNIGITTTFELISGDRKLHYYTFFNEVVDVIINEILASMLWEV